LKKKHLGNCNIMTMPLTMKTRHKARNVHTQKYMQLIFFVSYMQRSIHMLISQEESIKMNITAAYHHTWLIPGKEICKVGSWSSQQFPAYFCGPTLLGLLFNEIISFVGIEITALSSKESPWNRT
jgi:hypothetical protein